MMEERNSGKVNGLGAPVDADGARCFEVLRCKDKADVGVGCSTNGVLDECLLLS